MSQLGCICGRNVSGNGDVAGHVCKAGGKREHVGGLVLFPELAIQSPHLGVGGDADVQLAFEADGAFRASSKQGQRTLANLMFFAIQSNHFRFKNKGEGVEPSHTMVPSSYSAMRLGGGSTSAGGTSANGASRSMLVV